MQKKEKKKMGLPRYFLNMLVLAILLLILSQIITSIIYTGIGYYKYSNEFLAELILSLIVIVIVLLYKNSYVFTKKKSAFLPSIFMGLMILVLSICYFISAACQLDGIYSLYNVLYLALYCLTIGAFEELFCRGWIQNEFIERYGKGKKKIFCCIVCAAIIFGLIHLLNLGSQPLWYTLLQVLFSIGLGTLLGTIYYKTKNIWSVIFLHAFYDFSASLIYVNSIKECTLTTISTASLVYLIVTYLVLAASMILFSIYLLNKTSKKAYKELKKLSLTINVIALIMLFLVPISLNIEQTCYEYETMSFENIEFEYHFPQYDNYTISYVSDNQETYLFEFSVDENNSIVIKNNMTHEQITLDYDYNYNFEILENGANYLIVIYDYDNSKVYYSNYMTKDNLSNEETYLKAIKDSFIGYDVPTLSNIGYLTIRNSSYKYPYFESNISDSFYIDENGYIYLIES